MFCNKCGSESIEGAGFCQKCGAKLLSDENTAQQQPYASAPTPVIPPQVASTPNPVEPTSPQTAFPPVKPTKKKIKILPIILAIVAIFVVLGIIGASCSDTIQEHGATQVVVTDDSSSSSQANTSIVEDAKASTEETSDAIMYNFAELAADSPANELYINVKMPDFLAFVTDGKTTTNESNCDLIEIDAFGNKGSDVSFYYSVDLDYGVLENYAALLGSLGFDQETAIKGSYYLLVKHFEENIMQVSVTNTNWNGESGAGIIMQFFNADDSVYTANAGTYTDQGDFNQSINFGGLEIVIYNNHEIGRHSAVSTQNDYIFLFPQITNVGSSPATLSPYDVSIFGPNGSEITPLQDIFDNNVFYNPLSQGRGNIMPGASQTLMIIIPYQGAGDYSVFFSGLVSQESLSLPISRDTALSSRGIVGAWSLDASSDGYYASLGTENIEFLENGSGNITTSGTDNTFTWYILLTNQNSRLAVHGPNNTIIYSDTLIYPSSLSISNTSTYRLWTSAGIMRDESKQYEGADEFIRN